MKTLKQIRDKIIDDLDLYEESFVDSPEIDAFINEGIKIAEGHIHTLYEDYFLSTHQIPITSDENEYDYPADIFANKIRMIIYTNGSDIYEVKRSRDIKREALHELVVEPSTGHTLRWYPVNRAADGRKIRVFPNTSADGNLEVWYIRNANVLVNDDDVCDIDEYSTVVELHAKTQIFMKDGDPRTAKAEQLEQAATRRMINTLSEMIPDDDNDIDQDFSHYEDSV